jgi:hypothetical protein
MTKYLGDSVYITNDSGVIVIYLDNGIEKKHEIIMESKVIEELLEFLEVYYNRH